MPEKMNFGEIRRDIQDNIDFKNKVEDTERWWAMRDSSMGQIGSSFSKTLPKEYVRSIDENPEAEIEDYGDVFKEYVEKTLSETPNNKRTAIEFGGQGSHFFMGFSPKFFSNTVGVCLDDIRSIDQNMRDIKNGHSVVIGDIMNGRNAEMYSYITEDLETEKTDLIVSRMMGPLNDLAKNPLILDRLIRKWYSMLNDNGLMFIQFEYFKEHNPDIEIKLSAENNPPPIFESEDVVQEWADEIVKRFGDAIEIQLGRGVMRLHKKVGAPEELPKSNELFAV